MPQLNITLSGEANTSASGKVTDPTVLQQVKAIMRHLEDKAHKEAPAPDDDPMSGTPAAT